MTGKVYLVGAGPGRQDLITLRGLNILREADVVIYDYLVDKSILDNAKQGAELICCDKLAKKGKYSDGFLIHQNTINNLLVKKAKQGKKVIRLKNGDPSIFSRLSQELEALVKNKIEFEIVPGVTAASAAACFTGIPLTDRRLASSCIFVTGHEDPAKKESLVDWKSVAKSSTIVLYMAVENLDNIIKQVIEAGKPKDTPIAIIQNATLPTQKILGGSLKDIAQIAKKENLKPPAIIIIGEVVNLNKRFNWLNKNKRVLFTGLSPERFFIKGNYFHLPLIKIDPMGDYKEFDNHLENIKDFDWIIFASRYAVEYFFSRLKALGCDSRLLSKIKIAAIGNSTKNRLLDSAIFADLVAKNESSDGLIEEFRKIDLNGKKIFLPRSDISDKGLTNELEKLGAKVTASFAYRNIMPNDLPDLDLKFFDEIMFTSPSTVRNFKKRYGRIPTGIKISCISDVTLKEAKRCRLLD
jgi:uroporphyrinogen III methyltransferase/synthase